MDKNEGRSPNRHKRLEGDGPKGLQWHAHSVVFRKTHSLPITDTGCAECPQRQCAQHVQITIPTPLLKPQPPCFSPRLWTLTRKAIRTGESSRTTTPRKGSRSWGRKSVRAADPAEHPGRKGARAGCSPRDAGAAAPPRTRTAATPAAREPRPCLQAVGSDQPPCRASRKERTVETDTRSRSRRQTRRPRLSLRGKTTGWGSRGGGHTNWSRHLLLPGACGVHTPRRRSEPARTEGTRASGPTRAGGRRKEALASEERVFPPLRGGGLLWKVLRGLETPVIRGYHRVNDPINVFWEGEVNFNHSKENKTSSSGQLQKQNKTWT